MKLSQIRLLAWGGSMAVSAACGLGAWSMMQQAPTRAQFQVLSWVPDAPELPDQRQVRRLSNQRLMTALQFLTKVEEQIVEPEPVVVDTPVVEEPPKEELKVDVQLALINYDTEGGRHLAFLRKGREPAHPYLEGEDLGTAPSSRLKKIALDHVVLVAHDGREKVLYLKGVAKVEDKVSSDITRVRARTATVTPSREPEVTATPEKLPGRARVAPDPSVHRRYVPKTRDVSFIEDYGVSVVEYNPTEEGYRRFAVSDKDLKNLENQALRLMAEVAPSPSLDADGNPNGIRLDFLTEEPLAKSYGIRSGDVLTKVNGKSVTNDMEAQAIYDELGGKTRVVPIDILREGKTIRVYFEMDDFPGVPPNKK